MPTSDHEKERRALEAEKLLNTPVLQEAFAAVREKIMQEWVRSTPEQGDLREVAYYMLHALEDVQAQLTAYVQAGKFVVAQRNAEKQRREAHDRIRKWDGSPSGDTRPGNSRPS